MTTPMSPHGEFTKKEEAAFESGGALSTPKHRKEEARDSDFLMPEQRKYPYKIKGQISCNLLKAAITRSAQYNETDVNKRAKALFNDHC